MCEQVYAKFLHERKKVDRNNIIRPPPPDKIKAFGPTKKNIFLCVCVCVCGLGRNSAFPPTPEEKLREEDRRQLDEEMLWCARVVDAAEKKTLGST